MGKRVAILYVLSKFYNLPRNETFKLTAAFGGDNIRGASLSLVTGKPGKAVEDNNVTPVVMTNSLKDIGSNDVKLEAIRVARATASSTWRSAKLFDVSRGHTAGPPWCAFDNDPRTCWTTNGSCEPRGGIGAWIEAEFDAPSTVSTFAYQNRTDVGPERNKDLMLHFSDGSTQGPFRLQPNEQLQTFKLQRPVRSAYCRIEIVSVYNFINNGATKIEFYGSY